MPDICRSTFHAHVSTPTKSRRTAEYAELRKPAPRHGHYRDVCFATLQSIHFERIDQIAMLAVR
jgi:hypothetical protein